MKRVLIVCFLFAFLHAGAQSFENEMANIAVRIGAGYAHDFPGLNGYAVHGEVSSSISDQLQGAIGVKRFQLAGYPRAATVNEYTKATTIDFNLYYLPVQSPSGNIRLGIGYAFSFYSVRRAFPVYTTHGTESALEWPIREPAARTSGVSLLAEYEYEFPGTNCAAGLRAAWYKAYDRVTYIGPFLSFRL